MSKQSGTAGGKQATLFGFFSKQPPGQPAPPGRPKQQQQQVPLTPSASSASNAASSSSSIKSKFTATDLSSASTSSVASHAKRAAASAYNRAEGGGPVSGGLLSETIDLSSDGFEEDAVGSKSTVPAHIRALQTSSSSSSTVSKQKGIARSTIAAASPAHTSETEMDDSMASGGNETGASEMDVDDDDLDVAAADEDDGPTGSRKSRAAKKRQIIEDSDSEVDSEVSPATKKKLKAAARPAANNPKATKKKRADSEDYEQPDSDAENKAAKSEDYDDDDSVMGAESDAFIVDDDLSDAPMQKKKSNKTSASSAAASKSTAKSAKAGASTNRPALKSSKSGSGNVPLFATSADLSRERRVAEDRQGKDGEAISFDFLRPEKIRDGEGRRRDDKGFDPRTLSIPSSQYNALSNFEKQFWDIKRNYMDTILFFQKGKFFELYEGDARIAHQIFDLKITSRVKMPMAGVPEASIDYWTAKFLGQGYKVGRVDQVETAIGADIRRKDAKAGKGKSAAGKTAEEKQAGSIVNRELRSILTNGTIVDGNLLKNDLSDHCISIKEFIADASSHPRFGVVIADCSTAEFTISAFEDDDCRTRLETTIRQHRPREIICEKGNLSVPTLRLLRACVGPACSWNNLKPEKEFLTAQDAITGLEELFWQANSELSGDLTVDEETVDKSIAVPNEITDLYDNKEAMSAMGGMLWYLKGLNLERDLFTVKNFSIFDPIKHGQALVLDGQTLAHIEVLQNSVGTDEGTLFKLMCRCSTPFGKRMFKVWVCHPLREASAINARLDAVEDIIKEQAFITVFERDTRGLKDLERLLSRIHAGVIRVKDFIDVLDGFEQIAKMFEKLAEAASDFKSDTLGNILRRAPDMSTTLKTIRDMFVVSEKMEMTPGKTVADGFHEMADAADVIERELDKELRSYRKMLGASSDEVVYKNIGTKDIYQIEVPMEYTRKVPDDWVKMSSTKAVLRFWSPRVKRLVQKLKEARERRDQASTDYAISVFKEFDKDYKMWMNAVKITSEIDCLVSLAKTSLAMGEPAVRPTIIESDRAMVDFQELRNPCIFDASSDFIPNDIKLGGDSQKMILLTGPNMAGKSTLLRMTCIGVIMAQLGCYVAAKSARISPCDRIVSRMGAGDNILAGQSTFRVEMEDCRKVLAESTPRSLVILDELGRGTSTFDGLSIAYAVLHQLAGHLGCVGFFATHFTSLVDDFANHPEVSLRHMKTFVDESSREVTFLYKLAAGSAPRSYGPHVARMAGVPLSIVEKAIEVSKKNEEATKAREMSRRKDQSLPLNLQADAAYLYKIYSGQIKPTGRLPEILDVIRRQMRSLELAAQENGGNTGAQA